MNKEREIEFPLCGEICNKELDERIVDRVSDILKTKGIKQIVKNYLPEKLEECGWNKHIFDECVKWLKANTASGQRVFYGQKIREEFREPDDVDPRELIEPLLNLGIQLMPECIIQEIKEQIIKTLNGEA
nr:enhancer of yellow 2 transcription factor [Hymenolepis microstoma]